MIFCSVCFGDPSSPLTQGYNYAVLAMLGVTALILGILAVLFINFRKRTRKIATDFQGSDI